MVLIEHGIELTQAWAVIGTSKEDPILKTAMRKFIGNSAA
jgi:hypothetical protein